MTLEDRDRRRRDSGRQVGRTRIQMITPSRPWCVTSPSTSWPRHSRGISTSARIEASSQDTQSFARFALDLVTSKTPPRAPSDRGGRQGLCNDDRIVRREKPGGLSDRRSKHRNCPSDRGQSPCEACFDSRDGVLHCPVSLSRRRSNIDWSPRRGSTRVSPRIDANSSSSSRER